jgi:hypothetical protein
MAKTPMTGLFAHKKMQKSSWQVCLFITD